jgi:hypothetical protein
MKRMKPFAVLLAAMVPVAPVAVALAAEPPAPPAQTLVKTKGAKADGPLSVAAAMKHGGYRHKHQKLVRSHFTLVRSLHGKVSHSREKRVHAWSVHHLRHANRTLRKRIKATRPTGVLIAIAQCESHGNPRAIGGGGAFRGKYQFDYGTWASVGGKGDPAAAPEAEQDRRAKILYARAGASPWPVCGR